VRLCPPASITDADLAEAERQLREEWGAAAVKVVRREVAVLGVGGKVERVEAMQDARSHREVVDAKLQSVKTDNPDELRAIVLRALEEGAKQSKPIVKPRNNGPLYITSIRVVNWQRFQGQNKIDLEQSVYALTAEHEEQSGRSNWLGKSSLLGTIPFALYGWHTRPKEDAWISDGESGGGISLVLSDGTTVMRSRARGKSNRVVLQRPDGSRAEGDEAQREIIERVGLTEADFFSTSFFVQKSIGQFVTMQPAKRQELIAGWLALGPLRAAEDWARDMLDQAAGQEMKQRERLAQWEQEAKQIEERWSTPELSVEQAIAQHIAIAEKSLKESQEHASTIRAQNQSAEHVGRRRESIEQARITTARAASELGTAEADMNGVDSLALQSALEQAREEHSRISIEWGKATSDTSMRKGLLVSGFDGRCPIAQIECPATSAINARREEANAQYQTVRTALDKLNASRETASTRVRDAEQAVQSVNMKANAFREKMRAFDAAKKAEESLGSMPEPMPYLGDSDLAQLDANVRQYAREIEQERTVIAQYQAALKQVEGAKKAAEQAAKESALYGAAARLLGRGEGGAQKDIAAGALAVIEASTNQSLAESGVDLSVSLKWGTESTTELATYCSSCGASFPASKRVKNCARCNAVRGPKVDEKIDFALSDRSGAAEDLAGFHLQVAAAAWLYGQRGVPWRVIAVDEPFGALDEAHRKSMGVHVARLLKSRYAFEQAFVIAHDTSSTDAMPGRIRVIAGVDGWSRVEVQS
jgi:DNA repair exonuclease SbcCD ATPase subunit